jgi:SAM-dependent methyltransferase
VRDVSLPADRWHEIAVDPMDSGAIAWRQATIESSRGPRVPDRLEYLRRLATGKRVLDIGVVDHTCASERASRWLHGALVEVADSILGVDVLTNEIEALREKGFNVQCMDVTTGERPEGRFDLIVAGEVIEHLGNPGGLFDAAASLLENRGRLVLSTPNPYAVWRVFQNLMGRPHENVDHVLLLSPWGVAELAERAGLRLDKFRGIATRPVGWKARAVERAIRWRILPMTQDATCESILYECVFAAPTDRQA